MFFLLFFAAAAVYKEKKPTQFFFLQLRFSLPKFCLFILKKIVRVAAADADFNHQMWMNISTHTHIP